MKFSTISATLATATLALAMPAVESVTRDDTIVDPASGLTIHKAGYQGDGFYQVTFGDNKEGTVEFTPTSAKEQASIASQVNSTDLSGAQGLNKRNDAGITCFTGSGHAPDLDTANVGLARELNGRSLGTNVWYWWFQGNDVSFVCSYVDQLTGYDTQINFHRRISGRCGGSHRHGFQRSRFTNGAQDMAVGRTNRGGNFCTTSFRG
ncbi:hypothetical protein Slin14017_G098380 [Septoria linicola]|nr:hypothetical protein Slin14017_G098380 [Septoria linicola]